MTNTPNFRAVALPKANEKPEQTPRCTLRSSGLIPASNDNFSCFEQYVFERAVMRELSGDVDF